jgi:hypothetical protein
MNIFKKEKKKEKLDENNKMYPLLCQNGISYIITLCIFMKDIYLRKSLKNISSKTDEQKVLKSNKYALAH